MAFVNSAAKLIKDPNISSGTGPVTPVGPVGPVGTYILGKPESVQSIFMYFTNSHKL